VRRGYGSGSRPLGHPPRWHPAEAGPPLEPIEKLIGRAELDAELEWRRDHGDDSLWDWPLPPPGWEVDDATRTAIFWPNRWFRDRLFELPPLGVVPPQWLMLFS
jgi:hypothetical protein